MAMTPAKDPSDVFNRRERSKNSPPPLPGNCGKRMLLT